MGGVVLNLNSIDQSVASFREMKARLVAAGSKFSGVMLQEMIQGGVETIIGMNHDLAVGPLIMFGLGGVSVEVMKDVAFKVHPLTDLEADEMIKSVKGYKLLTGFRGASPVDLEALKETLLRLSQLVSDFPQFSSFDVNPFFATPFAETSMAVDARFILKLSA
jgi:acyl-CoA synthetase (NDP forming)